MKIAAGGFKKVIPYLTKISFEILKASSFLMIKKIFMPKVAQLY